MYADVIKGFIGNSTVNIFYFISLKIVKKLDALSKELDAQEGLLRTIERQPECDRFIDAWKALVRDTRP